MLRELFIKFLIALFLPKYHLAKNPPAGTKRARKAEGTDQASLPV